MALHPWSLFEDRFRWMDDLVRATAPAFRESFTSANVFPPVNIYDDGTGFVVRAEIPGLDKEGLEVNVKGEELTLKGERRFQEPAGASFHRRECGHGKFARVVTLPAPVDAEKIAASYRDGVLEVVLPRAVATQPKRIQVH
jgi:HSP20 family protein